jgi:hypothetical protein
MTIPFISKKKFMLVQIFFIVFLYMYCSYQEERVGIALNGLTPPHVVPTTGHDLDSQHHMLWYI